jgi:hypothetical protein
MSKRLDDIREKRRHLLALDEHYMGCGKSSPCPGRVSASDVDYLLDRLADCEKALVDPNRGSSVRAILDYRAKWDK